MFFLSFFFFNDTATTEIYTLSLHDALPISACCSMTVLIPSSREPFRVLPSLKEALAAEAVRRCRTRRRRDRKSTRLNSSHANISYAVFCLKKTKQKKTYINDQATFIHSPNL